MRYTTRAAIRIPAAAAGMILGALFSHHGMPWSAIAAGGLIMTGTAIWAGQRSEVGGQRFGASLAEGLGLDRFSIRIALVTLAAIAMGVAAGLLHRDDLGLPLQAAAGVQAFVVVACLIGATEELLYRGWLLGQARVFGWPAAIVVAAVAHAAYKTALFAWPATPAPFDLWNMMLVTTVAGLVLGLLRKWSGSLLPAIAAHIAFDFIVYRAVAEAPWWIWG